MSANFDQYEGKLKEQRWIHIFADCSSQRNTKKTDEGVYKIQFLIWLNLTLTHAARILKKVEIYVLLRAKRKTDLLQC